MSQLKRIYFYMSDREIRELKKSMADDQSLSDFARQSIIEKVERHSVLASIGLLTDDVRQMLSAVRDEQARHRATLHADAERRQDQLMKAMSETLARAQSRAENTQMAFLTAIGVAPDPTPEPSPPPRRSGGPMAFND